VSHPLVERLRSPQPDERIAACRDAVDDPSALFLLDALGDALGDPVEAVALAASDALARLARSVDGVEAVIHRALRSDAPSQRWHAALTSARIEPPTPRLLPAIVEALASTEADVRWMAARLLVDAGRILPEVVPLAIGLVTGAESAEVRRMATHCVRELAPERAESERALLVGSRDPERSVRCAALTALVGLSDPSRQVFDRLAEIAADPSDAAMRKLAVHALAALACAHPDELTRVSAAALQKIAAGDPDLELRERARHALNPLGKAHEAIR